MAALRGRLPRVSALDRVSGLFRVFRSSGKSFPGGPPGAPKDQLPRELNGRKCGARAWVPLVLPFFARGTCRRCAQGPWQRLLQKAERLLRGSRSLPEAPRALVSQMPRLLVVRREPAVHNARQPCLAVARVGHTGTPRCGRLPVAQDESRVAVRC